MERHAATHSATRLLVRDSSRFRIQPLRTYVARHSLGFAAIRADDGPCEGFPPQDRKPLRRNPATVVRALRGLGLGEPAQSNGTLHRHGNRTEHLRLAGTLSVAYGISIPRRLLGHEGQATGMHR